MSSNNCKVSVVVLNYNDQKTTSEYVETIQNFGIIDHIVIVDNCSTDGSYAELCELRSEKVDVIQSQKNGGYGYGNNVGVKHLCEHYNSQYIAISNPDVEVSENAIIECLNVIEGNDDVGVVAPMMKNPNGSINVKCVWKIPTFYQYLLFSTALLGKTAKGMYYSEKDLFKTRLMEVGCIAGSFLIVDKDKFIECGMYDENIFLYCEETVLGLRMASWNYKTILITDTYFIHHHSVSIRKSIQSTLKQRKIMWDSRVYVLYNYWPMNVIKRAIINIVRRIALIESSWLSRIKRVG